MGFETMFIVVKEDEETFCFLQVKHSEQLLSQKKNVTQTVKRHFFCDLLFAI